MARKLLLKGQWVDGAREALSHPDLSKDMHAALAHSGQVVAEGLPGPALARHIPTVRRLATTPSRPGLNSLITLLAPRRPVARDASGPALLFLDGSNA
jgi:hypothetical protein